MKITSKPLTIKPDDNNKSVVQSVEVRITLRWPELEALLSEEYVKDFLKKLIISASDAFIFGNKL